MRRTMILVTYLSLLATIGSFIVSAMALLMDRGEPAHCPVGDTELRALNRQSPPGNETVRPKTDETVRPKNEDAKAPLSAEEGARPRILWQNIEQSPWRLFAVAFCAAAIVICSILVVAASFARWMGVVS